MLASGDANGRVEESLRGRIKNALWRIIIARASFIDYKTRAVADSSVIADHRANLCATAFTRDNAHEIAR